jgi:membrane-bound metal-dependent hydrolase YbcI (DUF457 family)
MVVNFDFFSRVFLRQYCNGVLIPIVAESQIVLPWGHLAVGYIVYSLGVRLRHGVPPEGPAVIALAVGTQLPDLIDKPLAWTFGVLPSGRSLGHSLLFAVLLGAVVWALGKRYNRRPAVVALLIGYLSHVIVDVLPAVRAGQWEIIGALLWPVLPVYQYPGELDRSVVEFLLALDFTALPLAGVVGSVLALGLWVFDGMPGVRTILYSIRAQRLDHS